ncbi:MAG: XrtA/PEP-CTERM system TPR-repeat protein PrsT [Janthinobacterium lividum]
MAHFDQTAAQRAAQLPATKKPAASKTLKAGAMLVSGMILLTGGLSACSKAQTSESLLNDAKSYQQKGDRKAAIIQLKNALQKNPDDAEVRFLLGSIYNETGDPQSAEVEIRKAMALKYPLDKTMPQLGRALLAQGQFQKVLDETKLPAGAAVDSHNETMRGNAFLALGKSVEAKFAFDNALKATPDLAEALIGLSKLEYAARNIDGANKYAELATSKNPSSADAWLYKGDLLRAQGKGDAALSDYGQAIKLRPDQLAPYVAKATAEIAAAKFDAAKVDLDAAKKLAPTSLNVIYTQALFDFTQGRHKEALESLQQILKVAPDHLPSVLMASAAQYALGSYPQAQDNIKKYLERNPRNSYASKLMASILLKSNDPKRALEVLGPIVQADPKDLQALTLTGEAYMATKEYPKATEYFERASEVNPKASPIRTALGMSQLAQGENARGLAELELATNLDPKLTQAGMMLAMTQLRLKDYDKALAALAPLEKTVTDNPIIYGVKGAALAGKRDFPAARAAFDKALTIQPTYFPAVASLAQLDLLDKHPEDAKRRFEKVLESDKKNVQAMTALSSMAMAEKQPEEATRWLERAANDNPTEVRASLQLGAHYLRINEKDKALALAKKLQIGFPEDNDVLDLMAQAQLATGDKDGALTSYRKLVARVPDSPIALYRLGAVQMSMKNSAGATDSLKKALALKADYAEAEIALASIYARDGKYDDALAIARAMQKQTAKSAFGQVVEGDVLSLQKKYDAAAKAYEAGFAISASPAILIKAHEAMTKAGKGKEADLRLVNWSKAHPEDTSVRSYLATVSLMKNDNKSAITQYEAILEKTPNDAAVLNNLALAYQQEKNPRAVETAEKALKLAPQSSAVMDTLGWMLVETGQVPKGLAQLQKAIAVAPNALDIRLHLAQALLKSGDKPGARKELEKVVADGANFAKVDEAKALLKTL